MFTLYNRAIVGHRRKSVRSVRTAERPCPANTLEDCPVHDRPVQCEPSVWTLGPRQVCREKTKCAALVHRKTASSQWPAAEAPRSVCRPRSQDGVCRRCWYHPGTRLVYVQWNVIKIRIIQIFIYYRYWLRLWSSKPARSLATRSLPAARGSYLLDGTRSKFSLGQTASAHELRFACVRLSGASYRRYICIYAHQKSVYVNILAHIIF